MKTLKIRSLFCLLLVQVDMHNVRHLVLRVRRSGEGGRIHADWVDAKLVK